MEVLYKLSRVKTVGDSDHGHEISVNNIPCFLPPAKEERYIFNKSMTLKKMMGVGGGGVVKKSMLTEIT